MRPLSIRIPLRLLLPLTVFAGAVSNAGAVTYTITELGTLGGNTSSALAVNDSRQVTGNAQESTSEPSPRLNAFAWSPGETMQNLGTLAVSNNFSRGYAINNQGVVVGESGNGPSHAFSWQGGVMTQLDGLNGAGSTGVAHGINNSGVIVGTSFSGSASRATRWTAGVPKDLGSLDGLSTSTARAWDINDAGAIAGVSNNGTHSQATFWTTTGELRALDSLAVGKYSFALALNDSNTVVGGSVVGPVSPTSSTDLYHAAKWTQTGDAITAVDLGIHSDFPGYIHSEARDISNSGVTVGYVAKFYGNPTFGGRAVLWDANNQILDLNTLLPSGSGWELLSAEGINAQGDIVGYGLYNGSSRAFLLTAVPEPSLPLLAGTGLAAFGLIRKRQSPNPCRR